MPIKTKRRANSRFKYKLPNRSLLIFVIAVAIFGGVWLVFKSRADHCIPSSENYCVIEGDNINRTYCEGVYYSDPNKALPKPPQVDNLRATGVEANFIVLEWNYISTFQETLDAYFEVYRNGQRIDIFPEEHQVDNKEKYEDVTVVASTDYIYQIRALHSCLDKNGNPKNRYGDFVGVSARTKPASEIDVKKTIETITNE